ncbi:MAG: cysteine peptidase family C39 domain-containing protein, partial [Candidatus Omnitrophica bacterium]|nr:cysteine peptidase family C39 domain-containing protein [Candidatus Omnitrophota bacterium]
MTMHKNPEQENQAELKTDLQEQEKAAFKSSFKAWIRVVAFIVVAVFLPEQVAQAVEYDWRVLWQKPGSLTSYSPNLTKDLRQLDIPIAIRDILKDIAGKPINAIKISPTLTINLEKPLNISKQRIDEIYNWLVGKPCGSKALYDLLAYKGIAAQEQDIAVMALTTDILSGVLKPEGNPKIIKNSLYALSRASEFFGVKLFPVKLDLKQALSQKVAASVLPFIAHLKKDHYILVTRITDEKVYFADEHKEEFLPKAKFLDKFSGYALVPSLVDSFQLLTDKEAQDIKGAAAEDVADFYYQIENYGDYDGGNYNYDYSDMPVNDMPVYMPTNYEAPSIPDFSNYNYNANYDINNAISIAQNGGTVSIPTSIGSTVLYNDAGMVKMEVYNDDLRTVNVSQVADNLTIPLAQGSWDNNNNYYLNDFAQTGGNTFYAKDSMGAIQSTGYQAESAAIAALDQRISKVAYTIPSAPTQNIASNSYGNAIAMAQNGQTVAIPTSVGSTVFYNDKGMVKMEVYNDDLRTVNVSQVTDNLTIPLAQGSWDNNNNYTMHDITVSGGNTYAIPNLPTQASNLNSDAISKAQTVTVGNATFNNVKPIDNNPMDIQEGIIPTHVGERIDEHGNKVVQYFADYRVLGRGLEAVGSEQFSNPAGGKVTISGDNVTAIRIDGSVVLGGRNLDGGSTDSAVQKVFNSVPLNDPSMPYHYVNADIASGRLNYNTVGWERVTDQSKNIIMGLESGNYFSAVGWHVGQLSGNTIAGEGWTTDFLVRNYDALPNVSFVAARAAADGSSNFTFGISAVGEAASRIYNKASEGGSFELMRSVTFNNPNYKIDTSFSDAQITGKLIAYVKDDPLKAINFFISGQGKTVFAEGQPGDKGTMHPALSDYNARTVARTSPINNNAWKLDATNKGEQLTFYGTIGMQDKDRTTGLTLNSKGEGTNYQNIGGYANTPLDKYVAVPTGYRLLNANNTLKVMPTDAKEIQWRDLSRGGVDSPDNVNYWSPESFAARFQAEGVKLGINRKVSTEGVYFSLYEPKLDTSGGKYKLEDLLSTSGGKSTNSPKYNLFENQLYNAGKFSKEKVGMQEGFPEYKIWVDFNNGGFKVETRDLTMGSTTPLERTTAYQTVSRYAVFTDKVSYADPDSKTHDLNNSNLSIPEKYHAQFGKFLDDNPNIIPISKSTGLGVFQWLANAQGLDMTFSKNKSGEVTGGLTNQQEPYLTSNQQYKANMFKFGLQKDNPIVLPQYRGQTAGGNKESLTGVLLGNNQGKITFFERDLITQKGIQHSNFSVGTIYAIAQIEGQKDLLGILRPRAEDVGEDIDKRIKGAGDLMVLIQPLKNATVNLINNNQASIAFDGYSFSVSPSLASNTKSGRDIKDREGFLETVKS